MAGDDEPQISILDARLAEIDRRLSRIQTGLAEEVAGPGPGGLPPRIAVPEPGVRRPVGSAPAPPPVAPPPPPEEDDAGDDAQLVVAELRGLIFDHARLLDRLGEILASGERLLAAAAPSPPAASSAAPSPPASAAPSPPAGPSPAGPPAPEAITVSAGPFANLDAVRGFERALRSLPGVEGAEVRGYEGGDRALVDVHLSSETA